MDKLIAFMESMDNGSPHLMMGAFSNGPSADGISGQITSTGLENFEKAEHAGFFSANID